MVEERRRLIQQLDQARAKMWAVIAHIDPKREIYPGWTIKHVLAHITGWDDAVIASLQAYAEGKEPGTLAVRGINVYNAQSVATREALSYDQVVNEWELAREQVKDILNKMPAGKFEERFVFPWGGKGTIAQLTAIFVEHEEEHAEEIQGLVGQ
jgi:hypothetical protein